MKYSELLSSTLLTLPEDGAPLASRKALRRRAGAGHRGGGGSGPALQIHTGPRLALGTRESPLTKWFEDFEHCLVHVGKKYICIIMYLVYYYVFITYWPWLGMQHTRQWQITTKSFAGPLTSSRNKSRYDEDDFLGRIWVSSQRKF